MSAILIVVIVCLICFTVLLSTSMICDTVKQGSSKTERRLRRLENAVNRLEDLEEKRRRELKEMAKAAGTETKETVEPVKTIRGIYVGRDGRRVEIFR